MRNLLRVRRTPSELAVSGQVIEINEKIHDLERLAEILAADLRVLEPDRLPAAWRDSRVTGRLSFGFVDAQNKVPALDGRVAVTIDAVCQRCLEPFRLPLEARLRLVFATDQPVTGGAGEYEVWELSEATLRPVDVVEEALIMALPLAAMHEKDAACQGPEKTAAESAAGIRPFAELKSQMDTKN